MIARILQVGLLLVIPAFCEHPDLTGSWRLDTASSSFGAMSPVEWGQLTIETGHHKMMRMAFSVKGSNGERMVESEWKVDDKFHPMTGDGSGEVLAKWEGSILVGRRVADNGMEEIRLRLDPGGATMTESIQSSRGLTTLIWRRL